MSCEKACLQCPTLQKYKINHARYHGICQNHSTLLKNITKCKYCNSIVPILFIELTMVCSNCNETCSCSYSSCDHTICENCFNSGKFCEKCITIKLGVKCDFCLEANVMKNSCCNIHKICEQCESVNFLCPVCEIHSDDSEKKLKTSPKEMVNPKHHNKHKNNRSNSSSRNQRTSVGASNKSEYSNDNEKKHSKKITKSLYEGKGFKKENEVKIDASQAKIQLNPENGLETERSNLKKFGIDENKYQSVDSSGVPKISINYESVGEGRNAISGNSNYCSNPIPEEVHVPIDKLVIQNIKDSNRTNDSDFSPWTIKLGFRCIFLFIIYCLTCCWNFGICFNFKLEDASAKKSRFWYFLSCLYVCKIDSENYKIWKYFLRCTFCELPTMNAHNTRCEEPGANTDLLNINIAKNA